jgi:hypothetical protein
MPRFLPLLLTPWIAVACAGCGDSAGEARAVRRAQEEARHQTREEEANELLHRSDDPATIADKVVKAHGGAKSLAKWHAGYLRYKFSGDIIPFPGLQAEIEETYQLPDKIRRVITGRSKTRFESTTFLKDGNKRQLFDRSGGQLRKELPPAVGDERPFIFMFDLRPLLDSSTKREVAGEGYVQGRPTIIMIVEAKEFPPVRIFLDKKNGLVVKAERNLPAPGPDNKNKLEIYYDDYSERDGLMMPFRITYKHGEHPLLEWTLVEARPIPSPDPAVFQKP